MIDEKKLIESINNQIKWMNNEAKTKSDEDVMAGLKIVLALIDEQEKIGEWIPCSERLTEERDSIFAKFKGTDKWKDAMFERISENVLVTVEFDDGTRRTEVSHTVAYCREILSHGNNCPNHIRRKLMDKYESYYQRRKYKGKTLLDWAVIWFKTNNDAFYATYGFNFNPHEYPMLYEIARRKVYG